MEWGQIIIMGAVTIVAGVAAFGAGEWLLHRRAAPWIKQVRRRK